jgi:hypothetical protein
MREENRQKELMKGKPEEWERRRRQERRIEGNMDWKRRTEEYSIRICKHRQVLNEFWRIRGFR